jgi:hypothetical protein
MEHQRPSERQSLAEPEKPPATSRAGNATNLAGNPDSSAENPPSTNAGRRLPRSSPPCGQCSGSRIRRWR